MKKTRKFILPVVLLASLVAWIYGLVTDAPWLPWLAYPLWIAIALSMIGYVMFKRDKTRKPGDPQPGALDTPSIAQPPGNQPNNGSMIPFGGGGQG